MSTGVSENTKTSASIGCSHVADMNSCSVSRQVQPSRDWHCSCKSVSRCSFLNDFLNMLNNRWAPGPFFMEESFNRTWKCCWPNGADSCRKPSSLGHHLVLLTPGKQGLSWWVLLLHFLFWFPFNPRLNLHQIFATSWLAQRFPVLCSCFLFSAF